MAVSKKILTIWGANAGEAFDLLSEMLTQRGFKGPLTWKHGYLVPYLIDPCEDIRVILSISRCGGVGGHHFFDTSAVVLSKKIHQNSLPSDPWANAVNGDSRWYDGYVPCMVSRLSHMKWASRPSDDNPAWSLSADDTVVPGIRSWITDFDELMLPFILQLRSNGDLAKAMWDALHYQRPAWVKSDGPGFVSFKELFMALQRS
ncbi:hypothetical protein LPN04_10825 [Rugamonas sp. A1-17]|nr:hypothetical protein [Rugamonas sp. A1-17]